MDLAIDQRSPGNRWSLKTGLAGWGLRPVTRVAAERELLIGRRAGRIVVANGRLDAVYGRWWPYGGNLLQVAWDARFRSGGFDRCELYYHAPRSAPSFLTLSYLRSSPKTSLATHYATLLILDEIARLRQTSAIVCHVTNDRISDRLLQRWGWQAHCPSWRGRHFIKRLYGNYPAIAASWRKRLTLD